jgi:hypothetical protein
METGATGRSAGGLGGAAVVALAAWLLAGSAAAKTISISVTPTAEVQAGTLTVKVKITNSGDEAAQSVSPVLRFGDQETRGKGNPSLAPNGSHEETLTVQVGDLAPGRWPYRLAVDYTDANQYPFQALQVGTVTLGNAPPAKLAVPEVKAPGIAGTGKLQLRVKNLAGVERTVALAVVVPDGLEVTKPIADLKLAAWAEEPLSVPLANRTALAGSRYPIFVTTQYDDGGVHHTVVGQGIVEILAPQSFFLTWQRMLWFGAAGVVLVWMAVMLLQTARRSRGARAAGQ